MDIDEDLPENFEWYKNQIAGHHPNVISKNKRQIGIIKEKNSNSVLKLVQEGKRGDRETAFYRKVSQNNDLTKKNVYQNLMIELRNFLPKYYGQRIIKFGQKDIEFFELQDITNYYYYPCIMDIKIGRVTYDPTASEEKKRSESLKCACQKKFGFRVLGYRLNSTTCNEPKSRDRIWGGQLNEATIQKGFEEYFLRGWPVKSAFIINQFLDRLKKIKDWFDKQEFLHFYASSLLFVYEGEPENSELKNVDCKVDIRMIDFSHVFEVIAEKDENYIYGLKYIINLLQNILKTLD